IQTIRPRRSVIIPGAAVSLPKPCRSPATKKGRCRLDGGARGSGDPPGERNGQYRHWGHARIDLGEAAMGRGVAVGAMGRMAQWALIVRKRGRPDLAQAHEQLARAIEKIAERERQAETANNLRCRPPPIRRLVEAPDAARD